MNDNEIKIKPMPLLVPKSEWIKNDKGEIIGYQEFIEVTREEFNKLYPELIKDKS